MKRYKAQYTPPDFFFTQSKRENGFQCTPNTTAYCRISRIISVLISCIFFACGYGLFSLQAVAMSPGSPQVESLGTRLLQTVGMPPGSPQLSKGRTCKQGSSYAPGLHSLLLCMATWNFSVWQDFLQLHCLLNRILTQRKYKKWLFRMSRRWMLFRTGRQFILSRAV